MALELGILRLVEVLVQPRIKEDSNDGLEGTESFRQPGPINHNSPAGTPMDEGVTGC
jgi:hypothetical protein